MCPYLGRRSYRQDQGCVSEELMGDFEEEKGCRPLKKDTLQTSKGKSLGDIKGPKKLSTPRPPEVERALTLFFGQTWGFLAVQRTAQ